MKIYLFMCLNSIIGDRYYVNEEDVKKLVKKANTEYDCGDFWYQTLIRDESDKKGGIL